MFFSRILLASIALFSYASAQVTKVAFTSVPAVVVGGETYNITWGGGDGSTVTITLRKGNPDNLDTIGALADNVSGYSYNWTVSRSLEAGDDYALQITQGQDEINYSGQFSLFKGNGTSTSSADGSVTTSMSHNSSATTAIGLGGNNTATGNSTMSTSGLPRTITTTPATSAHTPSATNTGSAEATLAPNSGALQMTSSAALVVGVIAAVAFLS